MTDYWLSKLFFDLQTPMNAARYREDRDAVLKEYPLSNDALAALDANDVAALAKRVNPYLLRFYFGVVGMPDPEFIDHLRQSASD